MSEHEEQTEYIDWMDTVAVLLWPDTSCDGHCIAYAVPNDGKRSYGAAAYHRAQGLRPGVPDLCLPVARPGWHGLYIEMKFKKNKESDHQRAYREALNRNGYLSIVCYSAAQAIAATTEYLNGAK